MPHSLDGGAGSILRASMIAQRCKEGGRVRTDLGPTSTIITTGVCAALQAGQAEQVLNGSGPAGLPVISAESREEGKRGKKLPRATTRLDPVTRHLRGPTGERFAWGPAKYEDPRLPGSFFLDPYRVLRSMVPLLVCSSAARSVRVEAIELALALS